MKYKNKVLVCILLISIFVMSIGISNSIILSLEESLPNEWQTIGNYDEILEDQDRMITDPLYLCVGDSIRLNLTVVPQESQYSGVIVKIYFPDDVIVFPEDKTYGVKTVNKSVLLNDSSTEGNYWFEVVNPGGSGGDKMRVFGQCSYCHVDAFPDPVLPYDAFQVDDYLTYELYDRGYWYNIDYTVIWRVPDYIQLDFNDRYGSPNTWVFDATYQPLLDDNFYDDVMDEKFLPFNYNLSALEENPAIDPVFYDAQTLIQTDSGVIVTENTIVNESTVIIYITTIEYIITEIIPVKGVTWKDNYYNDTDSTWTNCTVRTQVHEPTGVPINLDVVVAKTGYSNLRYYYRLIDSHGIFNTKEFPIENITEYVYITEYVTVTEYVDVTEYITEYITDYVTEYVTVPEYITVTETTTEYITVTETETTVYNWYITITETIDNTEYITVTETVIETIVVDGTTIITSYVTEKVYETEVVFETTVITEETTITKQSTDFVSLSFIALAIVGIAVKRRRK